MGEKKEIKISLTTFFLIIAIIIIVAMGAFIYMQKIESDRKIAELQESINELQEKKDNNGSTTEKENNVEKLAKNTLDKYMSLRVFENSSVGPMPEILVKLGLETTDNINKLCQGVKNRNTYIKSNTSYEKFKETLLQYITEEYFVEKFSQYKNMDGYVGFCDCAAGISIPEVEFVKFKNKNSDDYIFEITFKDSEMYNHYLDGEEMKEDSWLYNKEVIFKYVNNTFVISKFE